MIESIKNFVIVILIIFGIIMSFLYWYEVNDRERYRKEKEDQLRAKESELNARELAVIDKETCMTELKKLKQTQSSIAQLLTNA